MRMGVHKVFWSKPGWSRVLIIFGDWSLSLAQTRTGIVAKVHVVKVLKNLQVHHFESHMLRDPSTLRDSCFWQQPWLKATHCERFSFLRDQTLWEAQILILREPTHVWDAFTVKEKETITFHIVFQSHWKLRCSKLGRIGKDICTESWNYCSQYGTKWTK